MRCSACDQDATLQWLRPATEEETAAHLDWLRGNLAQANEARRLSLRLQVASLHQAITDLPASLSDPDRRAFTARATAQADDLQAEHDGITDVIDLQHHLPVQVAVFGCDTHLEGL